MRRLRRVFYQNSAHFDKMTIPSGDCGRIGVQLIDMSNRNSSTSNQNAGTAIALVGLVFMSAAMLGLMALVLPQLLGVLLVILIFALPAVFHYLIWGWWLSRIRAAEPDAETADESTASIDPP
jgi:hypothetical protein